MRLTADGALAVHHDAEIPGLGVIATLGVADLPAHVPLLADVLAVCEGMVVNVEIKNAPQDPGWDPGEAVAALVAATIEEAGWSADGSSCRRSRSRRCAPSRRPTRTWPSAPSGASPPDPGRRSPRPPPPGSGPCTPSSSSVDPDLVERAPRRGAGRQRLDRQRARRPARHGGVGGRRGHHRPTRGGTRVRPWRRGLRRRPGAGPGGPTKARHRAEWRGTARVHKDGRP